MQYTPNYNLITVEGTDVVNPLVQMNPNFTDIDAAMFANKQAVIGSATELTAGTVHGITRLNQDSNYFKFTATSNWNAGDSMTVDGVAVSVFMSDGTTPSQGCYVINSEVFCIINGSRVTLYCSQSYALNNLTDVTTSTPIDNEALVYGNGQWSNKELEASMINSTGGTVASDIATIENNVHALSVRIAPIVDVSNGNKEVVFELKDSNNDIYYLMFRANAAAPEKITMYDSSWAKVWGM